MEKLRRMLDLHSDEHEYDLMPVRDNPDLYWLSAPKVDSYGRNEILRAIREEGHEVLNQTYHDSGLLVALIKKK